MTNRSFVFDKIEYVVGCTKSRLAYIKPVFMPWCEQFLIEAGQFFLVHNEITIVKKTYPSLFIAYFNIA